MVRQKAVSLFDYRHAIKAICAYLNRLYKMHIKTNNQTKQQNNKKRRNDKQFQKNRSDFLGQNEQIISF